MKQTKLLILILSSLTSIAGLTACNSGNGSPALSSSPVPSPVPIKPVALSSISLNSLSSPLNTYLSGAASAIYFGELSNPMNGKDVTIYGNDSLTNPDPLGWIDSNLSQYAFAYNAPYVQTYSPSPKSFLTPLVIKEDCSNHEIFLVMQPVTIQDEIDEAIAAQTGGSNVIVKYHSLYSNGITYPSTNPLAEFTLKSIDANLYESSSQIQIQPHDGVWSPADNNALLQTAFLDMNPHVIISSMKDSNGRIVYSVNNLINDEQLAQTLELLRQTSNLKEFRDNIQTRQRDFGNIVNALDQYNDLVENQCHYRLW